MKRGARPMRQTATATISGSNSVEWLGASTYAPSRGSLCPSMISIFAKRPVSGTTIAASGQKTLGLVFSADAARSGRGRRHRGYPMTSKSAPRASSFVNSFS